MSLNQFNGFARAGVAYVTASQSVIQAAGVAAVNTDSALLIKSRPDLNDSERRARVTESDKLLKERLHVLQLISAHGKLLQAYFEALAFLSDPKATNSIGTGAQAVYDSLAKMSPSLTNAKLGSTSVSSLIPKATAPLVATFRIHGLNEELKARSSAIANELALQEAALGAVEAELKTDAKVQQNLNEMDIINQFAASKLLPAGWASQRFTVLSTPADIASADAAFEASAKLRNAFTALVENRLDDAGLASLMSEISNILMRAQGTQSAAK